MDNNILSKFRKEYSRKTKINSSRQERLDELNNLKEALESTPIVSTYVSLLEEIDSTKDPIEEQVILEDIIRKIEALDITDTNDIYLYIESFANKDGFRIIVEKENPIAEFDRYIDIESLVIVDNPTENRDVFESDNHIIMGNDIYDVHDKFMADCIKEGQEVAIKRVLKIDK